MAQEINSFRFILLSHPFLPVIAMLFRWWGFLTKRVAEMNSHFNNCYHQSTNNYHWSDICSTVIAVKKTYFRTLSSRNLIFNGIDRSSGNPHFKRWLYRSSPPTGILLRFALLVFDKRLFLITPSSDCKAQRLLDLWGS